MVGLLRYAYCTGVYSSRKIGRQVIDSVAFRFVAAGQTPDFRTINEFRQRHGPALAALFEQVLRLCRQAGLGAGQRTDQCFHGDRDPRSADCRGRGSAGHAPHPFRPPRVDAGEVALDWRHEHARHRPQLALVLGIDGRRQACRCASLSALYGTHAGQPRAFVDPCEDNYSAKPEATYKLLKGMRRVEHSEVQPT